MCIRDRDTTISDDNKVIGSDADNSSVTRNYLMSDISDYVIGNLSVTDLDSDVSATEFGYLDGLDSNIQDQLDDKQDLLSNPIDFSALPGVPDSTTDYLVRLDTDGNFTLTADTSGDGDITFGSESGNVATWAEGNNLDDVPLAKIPAIPLSNISGTFIDYDSLPDTPDADTEYNIQIDTDGDYTLVEATAGGTYIDYDSLPDTPDATTEYNLSLIHISEPTRPY